METQNETLTMLITKLEAETMEALGYPDGTVLEYVADGLFEIIAPEQV